MMAIFGSGERRKEKILSDLKEKLNQPINEGKILPIIQLEQPIRKQKGFVKDATTHGKIDPIKSILRKNK